MHVERIIIIIEEHRIYIKIKKNMIIHTIFNLYYTSMCNESFLY